MDCACLAALEERGIRPDIVAGHSLGEYAGAGRGGVIDFADGLPLVLMRRALMERVGGGVAGANAGDPRLDSGGRERDHRRVAGASGVIANANDNAPGQIVISGDVETLQAAAPAFRALGARVMDLPVGGAFHSPLMADGQAAFAPILEGAPFRDGGSGCVQLHRDAGPDGRRGQGGAASPDHRPGPLA